MHNKQTSSPAQAIILIDRSFVSKMFTAFSASKWFKHNLHISSDLKDFLVSISISVFNYSPLYGTKKTNNIFKIICIQFKLTAIF